VSRENSSVLILSSSYYFSSFLFSSPKFFLPDDYIDKAVSREPNDENSNHTGTSPNDFHVGFKLFLDEHRAKMAAIAAAANSTTPPTSGV
jgi:hypothetical protein